MVSVLVILALILVYIGLHRKQRPLLFVSLFLSFVALVISLINLGKAV